MHNQYQFKDSDTELLHAAKGLLQKVVESGKIRPAQLVTVAKLQHVTTEPAACLVVVTKCVARIGNIRHRGDDRLSATRGGLGYYAPG